ncbi:MAG: hypothetical protein JWQ87_1925, partial [Candidatus Sulfotelmatobacter sp.]|nr:hypothetical protein [Candidatus Sulfotelmatobacter sp.]
MKLPTNPSNFPNFQVLEPKLLHLRLTSKRPNRQTNLDPRSLLPLTQLHPHIRAQNSAWDLTFPPHFDKLAQTPPACRPVAPAGPSPFEPDPGPLTRLNGNPRTAENRRRKSMLKHIVLPAVLLASCSLASAGEQLNDTAQLLTELIKIDTSNPPGNEATLAAFLKTKFEPLGL